MEIFVLETDQSFSYSACYVDIFSSLDKLKEYYYHHEEHYKDADMINIFKRELDNPVINTHIETLK